MPQSTRRACSESSRQDCERDRVPNAMSMLRKRLHYEAKDVAQLVNCDPSDVSSYENGWVVPTLIRALDLAAALRSSVDELYPEIAITRRDIVSARREPITEKVQQRMQGTRTGTETPAPPASDV